MTTETITMSNVRYITGTAKKVEKKLVSQNMLVFAATESKLKVVVDLMIKGGLKPIDEPSKTKSPVYHGWEIHKTPFCQTFTTPNRQVFQTAFKKAKKSAMNASKVALELALNIKKAAEDKAVETPKPEPTKAPKVIKKGKK